MEDLGRRIANLIHGLMWAVAGLVLVIVVLVALIVAGVL